MLRLRLIRVERDLTIVDVAKATGINRVNLGYLELGRLNPTTTEAQKLSAFYGIPAPDLFDHVDDPLVPSPATKVAALIGSEE